MNFLGVFGHVVMDYIISVPEFPKPNASIGISSSSRFFGGTGANLARMASRLGVKTSLASYVGENFPRDFYEALKEDGVDLEDLAVVRGYSTPMCYVFTDGKNQLNFINQGPMKDAHRFGLQEHTVESSRIIHIGTGRPKYYEKVVALGKELDREIAFDPGQEIHYVYSSNTFKKILKSTKYFFCNETELKKAMRFLNLKRKKDILKHAEVLILTKGDKGSEIHTKGEKFSIPVIKPKRFVDSTGAGDAYRAGFYAALSRDCELNVCGLAGGVAASMVVGTMGAQTKIPLWRDIKRRLNKISQ
ncbi:MAG: carbohydrate kinase family protein [Thermoplasmata archaeon]|nr:carbohydrate kinase family protein [Thermoplasmata archaeon]